MKLGPTRIWSVLRGHWDADFDREQAELDQAEYRVSSAQNAVTIAAANRQQVLNQLAALGDPQSRREKALAREESQLRASAVFTALLRPDPGGGAWIPR